MIREMHVMQQRAIDLDDVFGGEVAGMFDID